MAKKKYIAKSHISLSVRVSDKASAHITFSALTGGGSVFYTDDENLQQALEKHHKFGKLFKEDKTFTEQTAVKKAKAATPVKVEATTKPATTPNPTEDNNAEDKKADDNNAEDKKADDNNAEDKKADDNTPINPTESDMDDSNAKEDNTTEAEGNVTKITITCLDDAKDYLSEKFGISRTKLRSKKAIEEAAADNGIEFVGI
ncbi:MAG: hypothetical protein IKK89_03550 [Alistipes sp.]|nr:hypothetical protein [Alistipes sp.]